jgi:PAS domain S-box-containing protein
MNTGHETDPNPVDLRREDKSALALRLAHVENALLALTSGQVDAIITPDGRPHLLRPAAEQVRQNERRLLAVIESAADVIMVISRSGDIVFQNRATARWVGYGTGSLLGRNLFHLVHSDDLLGLYSTFFNVLEGFREEVLVEFRFQHHAGDYRTIEAAVGKLSDGPTLQLVLICRDATRRKSPLLSIPLEELDVSPTPESFP